MEPVVHEFVQWHNELRLNNNDKISPRAFDEDDYPCYEIEMEQQVIRKSVTRLDGKSTSVVVLGSERTLPKLRALHFHNSPTAKSRNG
jgi:hypothetical protein